MNYDNTQQYTFSYGLATAPQLQIQHQQLQQQQQQQQQQHVFQQQYNQAMPTSNVYHFQFSGSAQQKECQPVGLQVQHPAMISQSLLQAGMAVGLDNSAIPGVTGLDGMIYPQQKNNLKIIANTGRMIQQGDGAVDVQPTLIGLDVIGGSNYMDQGLQSVEAQHHNVGVTGQQNVFTYGKPQCQSWIPHCQSVSLPCSIPNNNHVQQANLTGTVQSAQASQNTLPSFGHLWSQFQQQKQVSIVPQPQQLNQYQQHNPHQLNTQQQFQNQLQQQLKQHPVQHLQQLGMPVGGTPLQTLPGIQMVKMHRQNAQGACRAKLPQLFVASSTQDEEVPPPSPGTSSSPQTSNSNSDNVGNSTTAVVPMSGPPKVTVTLDSLNHCETFPTQFPVKSETLSFTSSGTTVKAKSVKKNHQKASANKATKAERLNQSAAGGETLKENHSQSHLELVKQQWSQAHPKKMASSTGSSIDRSSSESSNFPSPPFSLTPPNSIDSTCSLINAQCPKTGDEDSLSSGVLVSSLHFPSSSVSSSLSTSVSSSILPSSLPSGALETSLSCYVPASTAESTSRVQSSPSCTAVTYSNSKQISDKISSMCFSVANTTTTVTSSSAISDCGTTIASIHTSLPLTSTNIECEVPTQEQSPSVDSEKLPKVKVPYSWQRKIENGIVTYYSPSGIELSSFDQICSYLSSDNTCKCGLECPIQVEKFFSLDPKVGNQPWTAHIKGEDLGNLCMHRREVLAMAAFHSSQSEVTGEDCGLQGKRRDRKKTLSGGEGFIVVPPKKLKTTITNAVNKHAMFLGNSAVPKTHPLDPAGLEISKRNTTTNPDVPLLDLPLSNLEALHQRSSMSPVSSRGTPGSCSTPGDFSESVQSGNISTKEGGFVSGLFNPFANADEGQQALFGTRYLPRSTISESYGTPCRGEEQMFHHANMVDHGSVGISSPSQQQAQFPLAQQQQPQLPANHHVFYPQSSSYTTKNSLAPQPGFYPAVWQSGSPTSPGFSSSIHSQSVPCCVNHTGFQHPNHKLSTSSGFHSHLSSLPAVTSTAWMESSKPKTKRPKTKKDKQKLNSIVDRTSPCAKGNSKQTKSISIPSTTVSFMENPTVFVAQQTAIINNSIASCQMSCSSPPADRECRISCMNHENGNTSTRISETPQKISNLLFSEKKNIKEEEEEDQKRAGDLDSNKSFSDSTENNDSAYLSQTGSDQERSDTVDGPEQITGSSDKSSGIFDFSSSEDQETVSCKSPKPPDSGTSPEPQSILQSESKQSDNEPKNKVRKNVEKKPQPKGKPRQKPASVAKESAQIPQAEINLVKSKCQSSLNGELSELLATNKWSIPALQQVLAQYSNGGPPQPDLKSEGEFPASSLLTAAAKAQLGQQTSLEKGMSSFVVQQTVPPIGSNLTVSKEDAILGVESSSSTTSSVMVNSLVHPPMSNQSQSMSSTTVVGNLMRIQQLSSGGVPVNMLLPGNMQTSSSESQQTVENVSKSQVAVSSGASVITQGIFSTAPTTQVSDLTTRLKLSGAPVVPSSLGPGVVASCSHVGTTVVLNNFGSQVMPGNAPMPPVSVSVVTNVTKSLTQVIPTIGINQTVFNQPSVPPQMLNTSQSGSQLLNTAATPQGTQLVNSVAAQGSQLVNAAVPQGVQLVNTAAPQGTQLVNAAAPQGTQLVNAAAPQGTQLVNAAAPQGTQLVNAATPQGTQLVNAAAPQGNQLVNAAAPQGSLVNTANTQGTQLVNSAPQGAQLMSTTMPGPQLVNAGTPQGTQLMNSLSIQGLNNQLVITNSLQQVSPSNSISQLSPALAGHILAQGHQQLQQVSPSFMSNSIQKQTPTSILNSQNIMANASISALTVNPSNADVVPSQVNILGGSMHTSLTDKSFNALEKMEIVGKANHVIEQNSPLTNAYAATSQPVFVIPQPNATPMVQVLGPSQQLTPPADLSVQSNNVAQVFRQSPITDQTQIQNLMATGFNPVQQMWNAITLGGVQHQQQQQQQQQQLQMLQLQQLMLQQLQSQGQNVQGLALPMSQTGTPGQTAGLTPQTVVNAMVPQSSLQLNPLVDINSLQQSLSPVAQAYSTQLSPAAAAQLHQMSSSLAVHQVTPISAATVGVLQTGTNAQGIVQAPVPSAQQQIHTVSEMVKGTSTTPPQPVLAQCSVSTPAAQVKEPGGNVKSAMTTPSKSPASTSKTSQAKSGSKSKSKAKKSETKKVIDPETEKNEEDIANAVQQILAQAVQQQKELSIAAKNQPPPPPKSKSKKSRESQARARANLAAKEHDLGKLASISDDVTVTKTATKNPGNSTSPYGLPLGGICKPGVSVVHHSSQEVKPPPDASTNPSKFQLKGHSISITSSNSVQPFGTSFVEQTLSESSQLVNGSSKKSPISLKDHLSSIVSSKDKDSSKKKTGQKLGTETLQTAGLMNKSDFSIVNGKAEVQNTSQKKLGKKSDFGMSKTKKAVPRASLNV